MNREQHTMGSVDAIGIFLRVDQSIQHYTKKKPISRKKRHVEKTNNF